ncbi:hypothetical protein NIES4072_70520 [Nostoc commune NIES-4072]|uniref:Isochorismatase-like domain-containing protein n=1 Tax=Nostoc commune NIES-4072 TaxID=2005467 RepID=A0A2R5FX94_NOSCO|nr:isochorismatase family protein [Nostoc commune]BBD70685.1 hypothetical protein NIES4070_70960 [Nostoc commune HK-02]GBG23340.1 hypothetical protein NIES4072_70520 [Nostoc commune NIES-4072]
MNANNGIINQNSVPVTIDRFAAILQAIGMLANLCVEAHLRELLEQGFEVLVVKDATADPRHPKLGDGYKAALINFGYIANVVLSTDEVVAAMQ